MATTTWTAWRPPPSCGCVCGRSGPRRATTFPIGSTRATALNCEAIRQWDNGRAALMVTVDCGIASIEEAALARQIGLELIITDHHEPGPQLPDAAAIVHPRLPGAAYPFGGLSGSGVAFKLAWAICQQANGAQRVSPRMKDFLVQAVGLAALGTIADVVPLVDENRVLVHHGLASLAQCPTLGLATLMEVARIKPRTGPDRKPRLDCDDIGFRPGPAIERAAGRLGQPQLGVELLVTDRPDRARELAGYTRSAQRLAADARTEHAACRRQADQGAVRPGRGCGPGAGRPRLASGRHRDRRRPARREASSARRAGLLGHDGRPAGHRLRTEHSRLQPARRAAGVRRVPGLARRTCGRGRPEGGRRPVRGFPGGVLRVGRYGDTTNSSAWPTCLSTPKAPLSAFTLQTVSQIERLAPFGQLNSRPLLCTTGAKLEGPPKPLGAGGRHLSLRLSQHGVSFRAVAFGAADWAEELNSVEEPIDVVFRPVINAFQGRRNVELHLVDWRVSVS